MRSWKLRTLTGCCFTRPTSVSSTRQQSASVSRRCVAVESLRSLAFLTGSPPIHAGMSLTKLCRRSIRLSLQCIRLHEGHKASADFNPRLFPVQERVISNLAEYGNTSAASIPLALDEAVRDGSIKQGDVVRRGWL